MRWIERTMKGILVGLIVGFCAVFITPIAQAQFDNAFIRAVDQAATGANNGLSWTDAYTNLQDALDFALNNPGLVDEIWVAAGEYKPSKPFCLFCEPEELTERHNTFKLIDGVGIYGGFLGTALGGGEDLLSQRKASSLRELLGLAVLAWVLASDHTGTAGGGAMDASVHPVGRRRDIRLYAASAKMSYTSSLRTM